MKKNTIKRIMEETENPYAAMGIVMHNSMRAEFLKTVKSIDIKNFLDKELFRRNSGVLMGFFTEVHDVGVTEYTGEVQLVFSPVEMFCTFTGDSTKQKITVNLDFIISFLGYEKKIMYTMISKNGVDWKISIKDK